MTTTAAVRSVNAGSTVSADSESVDASTSAKRTDSPALEIGRRRVAPGVRGGHDFAVGRAFECPQRELERIGSARDGDAVRDAEVRGELGLECVVLRAEDVATALEHALDGCIELTSLRGDGSSRIRDGNHRADATIRRNSS